MVALVIITLLGTTGVLEKWAAIAGVVVATIMYIRKGGKPIDK